MIVWSARTHDHRLGDPLAEGVGPEVFDSSRAKVIAAMRELVVASLALVEENDDEQFPSVQPDNPDQPVEIVVERYQLADLTPRELALLNRRGWRTGAKFLRESIWISRSGRIVHAPPSVSREGF